jgi:hypothetical protein
MVVGFYKDAAPNGAWTNATESITAESIRTADFI